jgi:hypothetical protein
VGAAVAGSVVRTTGTAATKPHTAIRRTCDNLQKKLSPLSAVIFNFPSIEPPIVLKRDRPFLRSQAIRL